MFKDKYKLAWSTRWEKWVVIEKGDRDWDHAVTFEAMEMLGHDACLGYYLCSRRVQ